MPRKKLSLPDMMSQPYYKSIVTLTYEFECNDEFGIQQIHYRYALQENPEMANHYKSKMKKFFGTKLEKLFEESDKLEQMGLPRRIYRNCIKEGSHLSFYLKNLVDSGVLQRKRGEDKKFRYFYNHPWEIYPIDEVLETIKYLSGTALKDVSRGISPEFGNLYPSEGVFFNPFFIASPEFFFDPEEQEHKEEYNHAMENFECGIWLLAQFLRKYAKPNVLENKSSNISHHYGIFIDL
ncbi:MAG: hypothetical protein QCI00_09305, partial [Candidatus Thermoplasmatota archaeon]|nr:hypothetical protein [Candidatus Thermoplasmatota archaeon]